jgi:hypothetical protein
LAHRLLNAHVSHVTSKVGHAAGGTRALGSSSPPYPPALRPPPPSDLDRGAKISRPFTPAGDRGARLACAEPEEWLA